MQTFTDLPLGTRVTLGHVKAYRLREMQGLVGILRDKAKLYDSRTNQTRDGYVVKLFPPKEGMSVFIYPDEIASVDPGFNDKDFEEAFL